jgi:hypothetical protein
MTHTDLLTLILGIFSLGALVYLIRWTKVSNRRHGWDAAKDGLSFNPGWGRDICSGWLSYHGGKDRP